MFERMKQGLYVASIVFLLVLVPFTMAQSNETNETANNSLDPEGQALVERIEQVLDNLTGGNESAPPNVTTENTTQENTTETNQTPQVENGGSEPAVPPENPLSFAERMQIFNPAVHISEPRVVNQPITLTYEPADATPTYFLTINGVTTEIQGNSFTPVVEGSYIVSALMEWQGVSKTLAEQIYVVSEEEGLVAQQQRQQNANPVADYSLLLPNSIQTGSNVILGVLPQATGVTFSHTFNGVTTQIEGNSIQITRAGDHTFRAHIETTAGSTIVEETITVEAAPQQAAAQTPAPQPSTPSQPTPATQTSPTPQESPTPTETVFERRALSETLLAHSAVIQGPANVNIPEDAFNLSVYVLDEGLYQLQNRKVRTPVEIPIWNRGQRMLLGDFNRVQEDSGLAAVTAFAVHETKGQEGIITRMLRKLIEWLSGTPPTGLVIGANGVPEGIRVDLTQGLFEVEFYSQAKVLKETPPVRTTTNLCSFTDGERLVITSDLVCEDSLILARELVISRGARLSLIRSTIVSGRTEILGTLDFTGGTDHVVQNGPMIIGANGELLLNHAKVYFNMTQEREFGLDMNTGAKIQMSQDSSLENGAAIGGQDVNFLVSFDVHSYALG